jgi:tetratricopeptide (TPR) repeat protein
MRQKLEMASYILRNVLQHKFGAIVFPLNSFEAWRQRREYFKNFLKNTLEEAKQLEQLRNYQIDAFYHNVGNRDEYQGRFEEALQSKEILDVELDVLYYEGNLVIGHATESFGKYLKTNPNALGEQNLGLLIDACVEKKKGIHFDLKFSHDDKEAVDEFVKRAEEIPFDIPVKLSGRDWTLQKTVYERISRPKITLFTIDNHLGNTWDNYKEEIAKHLSSHTGNQIGVSIRDYLVTPAIIAESKKQNQYSLIYYVDSPVAALHFAEMGVSGITTNNAEILKALYKAKEPPQEFILFPR